MNARAGRWRRVPAGIQLRRPSRARAEMRSDVKLEWVGREDAKQYRVEILASDQSRIDEHRVVRETHLAFEDDIPPDALWRVYWSADGGSWQLHVPPVALPSAPDADATTVDWTPSGAPAYRMLIRDQVERGVVLKQAVAGPPGAVSWAELTPHHPHLVRIQEWRGGEWSDLHPYSELAVPESLLLGVTDPGRAATGFSHLVLVALDPRPPGHLHGERRPEQWLEQRLELLRRWTAPALASSQRDWRLVCDPATGNEALESLRETYPVVLVDELGSVAGDLEGPRGDMIAVTHLVAGDLPHPALTDRVGAHLADAGEHPTLVSFPVAARFDPTTGRAQAQRYAPAPAHTILQPAEDPLRDALEGRRPAFDPSYRRVEDSTITAVLRAWPGPNALPSLHGWPVSTFAAGDDVLDAFGRGLGARWLVESAR